MALSNTAVSKLTDKEKWECVARWINALYLQFLSQIPMNDVGDGVLSPKEALYNETNYLPCAVCTIERKCRNTGETIQNNFKIIEQFVGEDTIIGPFLPKYVFTRCYEERRADPSLNSDRCPSNDNGLLNSDM